MKQLSVLATWLCSLVLSLIATPAFADTVEFPSSLYFLTPGGEAVTIGPGTYQVVPAESWLKLIPDGKGPELAVLVEATLGTHEESVPNSVLRLERDQKDEDMFHLAMLLPDGKGFEAVGTVSGIRPRGISLTYLKKLTPQSTARLSTGPYSRPQSSTGTKAPTPGTKSEADCGPYLYFAGGGPDGGYAPTIMRFQNKLHVVYPRNKELRRLEQWTFVLKETRWGVANGPARDSIKKKYSKFKVAWAVYQDRLHMVHTGKSSHNIYHSYFDGKEWSPDIPIQGQKSKGTPALVVFRKELHMLHLGDSSNELWHSVYRGKGWTVNKKIGIKSGRPPALAEFGNRIHMVTTSLPRPQWDTSPKYLYHSQFNGKQWSAPAKIPGQYSKSAPALLTYGAKLHMVHLGNSSNNLWYS